MKSSSAGLPYRASKLSAGYGVMAETCWSGVSGLGKSRRLVGRPSGNAKESVTGIDVGRLSVAGM